MNEEEYITDENDPTRVEKITKEDYIISEKEETIEFDDIVQFVGGGNIVNLSNYDCIREKKVLDSLRKGEFR